MSKMIKSKYEMHEVVNKIKVKNITERSFMKKICILLFFIIISLTTLCSCGNVNDTVCNTALKSLKNKYGETFECVAIGNRINTGSTTLYLRPKKDRNNVFKVIYEDGMVYDEYVRSIILHKTEDRIEKIFKENQIDITGFTILSTDIYSGDELNKNISIEEFSKKYDLIKARTHCVFDVNTVKQENAEQIYNAIRKIDEVSGFTNEFWFFGMDKENYEKYQKDVINSVNMTSAMLHNYNIKIEFILGTDENIKDITKEDIEFKFMNSQK